MADMTIAQRTGPALPTAAVDTAMAMGTSVLTLDGDLPVEFLTIGDRVLTRAGARRLQGIEITVVQNARVIRIAQGSLGVDRPEADTIVTANQPILIRDWRAKALYGTETALVPAARLADGEYIRADVLAEVRLYTLRFAEEVVIYAGGLELACPAPHLSTARVTAARVTA